VGDGSVDVADLVTGNAEAGQQYFSGAGNCSKCHSASGEIWRGNREAGLQGLALLQRILYPGGRGRIVEGHNHTWATGEETLTGPTCFSRDEFSIVLHRMQRELRPNRSR
jgi:cytochrome c oxidase cbb3-type subunit 3